MEGLGVIGRGKTRWRPRGRGGKGLSEVFKVHIGLQPSGISTGTQHSCDEGIVTSDVWRRDERIREKSRDELYLVDPFLTERHEMC